MVKRDVIVHGINDGHDAGAALIKNGDVISAVQEERLAALHPYDGTCGPQTVRNEWNPSYYKIIKILESATGIGAVLNTSFNLHGYPMVGTPQMAMWTLANSKLDGLAIGNYLVTKE
jgi:carbamoyltransferase